MIERYLLRFREMATAGEKNGKFPEVLAYPFRILPCMNRKSASRSTACGFVRANICSCLLIADMVRRQ